MYFSLDDSTFKKSVIFKDGRVDFLKKINSPFVFNTNSLFKMDNKSYLYILQPFDDCNGFSISQMFLPETKHWLRSDDSLFIKYPHLQNLSNIVDNCSEFILNRNKFNVLSAKIAKDNSLRRMRVDENSNMFFSKANSEPMKLVVSPEEMSSCIQLVRSVEPKLDNIVSLIKELKGIVFIYDVNKFIFNTKIENSFYQMMNKYKSFIMNFYSLYPQSNSINSNIIIRESITLLKMIKNSSKKFKKCKRQIFIRK